MEQILPGVRIHNDEHADSLSKSIGARAFTYKNHIFFANNEFQPSTKVGQHLLAHELTHTIQQGAIGNGRTGADNQNVTPDHIQIHLFSVRLI